MGNSGFVTKQRSTVRVYYSHMRRGKSHKDWVSKAARTHDLHFWKPRLYLCTTAGSEQEQQSTLCVTLGILSLFKLPCHVYRGKSDKGLDRVHLNTTSTQKWVNLYDDMLEEFKGQWICVMMNLTYMGDVMGQIGRAVWTMNFLGRGSKGSKELKVGSYESVMFQNENKI
jgi:hypothetical protein